KAALVGDAYRNVVRARGFEVEQRSVGDRDHARIRIDGETAAGIVEQRIRQHRSRIGIGGMQGADNRAVRGVFCDGAVAEGLAGGRLVDVVQMDREILVKESASLVGYAYRNAMD